MRAGCLRFIAGILAALLISSAALAGPDPSAAEYRSRRESLMKQAGGGVILLMGAEKRLDLAPFRQNNVFFYLSGIEEPGAAMVLLPDGNKHLLFLKPTPESLEAWEGPGLKPGPETEKLHLFDKSCLYSELPALLAEIVGKKDPIFHLHLAPEEIGAAITDTVTPIFEARKEDMLDGRPTREENLRTQISLMFANTTVKDVSPLMNGMRAVKSASEQATMRKAAEITAAGWDAVLRAAAPGMYEYQLGSILGHECRMRGGQDWPYWPIVGSGPNSLILHYMKNIRKASAGEIVLMDAACGFSYMSCDVTRTFPISGKFSEEQARIYNDLLEVQEALVAEVKPGISLSALHAKSEEMLAKKGYKGRTRHFLGHYIGMAVHDPGDYNAPLAPGMAITIEPGIYIQEKSLGIRIEDTILVTETGRENLTAGIPKTIKDIEAAMARD